jgi:hypothetical protein
MSMVSHLHQLFNVETCQAYIHALRWQDRLLQCPRYQSHHVGPWGTYHWSDDGREIATVLHETLTMAAACALPAL